MSPLSNGRPETPPAHEDDSDEARSRGGPSRKRTARETLGGGDSDSDDGDEERSRGGPARKRTAREALGGGDSDGDDGDEERSRGGPSRKRTARETLGGCDSDGDDGDEEGRGKQSTKSHQKSRKGSQPVHPSSQKTRSQRRRM